MVFYKKRKYTVVMYILGLFSCKKLTKKSSMKNMKTYEGRVCLAWQQRGHRESQGMAQRRDRSSQNADDVRETERKKRKLELAEEQERK